MEGSAAAPPRPRTERLVNAIWSGGDDDRRGRSVEPFYRIWRRVAIGLVALVAADLAAAVLVAATEQPRRGEALTAFPRALYWCTLALLGLGSSIPDPDQTVGRVLAVVLALVSVAVVGTVIASVVHHIHLSNWVHRRPPFHHRGPPPHGPPPATGG